MEPVIWTLLLIGTLIGGGVSLSVYLYTRGVVGTKRSAHWQTFVSESALEDTPNDDQFYMNMSATAGTTSRYARNSIMLLLAGVGVVVMLLALMINSMLH